jgi:hypothetical protein
VISVGTECSTKCRIPNHVAITIRSFPSRSCFRSLSRPLQLLVLSRPRALPYRLTMLSPVKIAVLSFLFFGTMALAVRTSESQPQDPKALISNTNIALERALLPLSSCYSPLLRFAPGSPLLPFHSPSYLCQCDRRPYSPRCQRGCRNRC